MEQSKSQKEQDEKLESNKDEQFEEYGDDDIQIVRQLSESSSSSKNQSKKELIFPKPRPTQRIKTRTNKSLQEEHTDSPEYLYGKQIRKLFKQMKFKELVQLVQNDKKRFQEFEAFKYHGDLYKTNQNVMINNASNLNDDYIGKILKIIQIKEDKTNTYILLTLVRWFSKRNEVIRILPQHKSWISTNEIFQTDSTDYILTTAINSPCTILSLEEYEQLDNIERGVYFTRLKWIPNKNRFQGYDLIRKHCVCKLPINPDQDYIQCDRCDEWYHMSCVGVRKQEWEQKEYVCGRCR